MTVVYKSKDQMFFKKGPTPNVCSSRGDTAWTLSVRSVLHRESLVSMVMEVGTSVWLPGPSLGTEHPVWLAFWQ